MKKNFLITFYTILLMGILLVSGCRKQDNDAQGKFSFSTANLTFDTVFTTIGSSTRILMVYNRNNFSITTDIFLAGGKTSCFSINVDGEPGTTFREVTIPPRDSLYIFVKVNVNPGDQNNPFLIKDSVVFRTGEVQQNVKLLAYGQNAIFIVGDHTANGKPSKIVARANEEIRWTSDLPYVIYGWAVVDSLGSLIVEPGTQVYLHDGAGILVKRYGNIQVEGTQGSPVTFQSDRRESWITSNYSYWDRIWIQEGTQDNKIDYAVIKDAYIGLLLESVSEYLGNKTAIQNSLIHSTQNIGILGKSAKVDLTNCVLYSNKGGALDFGIGDYTVKHITIGNQSTTAIRLRNKYTDYIVQNGISMPVPVEGPFRFKCVNSIIYGKSGSEVSTSSTSSESFAWQFENCLFRSDDTTSHYVNCIMKSNPNFENELKNNYQLTASSPAIGKGKPGTGVPLDILGKIRKSTPDLGAYEY